MVRRSCLRPSVVPRKMKIGTVHAKLPAIPGAFQCFDTNRAVCRRFPIPGIHVRLVFHQQCRDFGPQVHRRHDKRCDIRCFPWKNVDILWKRYEGMRALGSAWLSSNSFTNSGDCLSTAMCSGNQSFFPSFALTSAPFFRSNAAALTLVGGSRRRPGRHSRRCRGCLQSPCGPSTIASGRCLLLACGPLQGASRHGHQRHSRQRHW